MNAFIESLGASGLDWWDLMTATPGGYAYVASGGKFESPRHITLLNRVIAETVLVPNSFTVIAIPPRHGKSFLVSHHTPAWYLTRYPDRRVMLAGYEAEFAASWGRKARDTFDRMGAITGMRVRQDNKASHRWEVESYAGEMYTAGVGGALTGRGGNLLICVTGDTIIETDRGSERIKDIEVAAMSRKVLGYDTATKQTCWQAIEAFGSRQADGVYRITTARGRVVEATAEHPFWTGERYVRADELSAGDCLLLAVPKVENHSRVRLPEVATARDERALLFEQLCVQSLQRKTRISGESLPVVRNEMSQGKTVLHGTMQKGDVSSSARTAGGESAALDMPAMRQAVCERANASSVLQYDLCADGSFVADDEGQQSRLAGWRGGSTILPAQPEGIPQSQATCVEAGRPRMRGVRLQKEVARSPYRHGYSEQPVGESGNSVHLVPHQIPCGRAFQAEPDSVALVEYLHQPTVVYSIRVAQTQNFFANGILTHNCDDPVKNAEAAMSATIRQATWDWYLSTFATRKEPGASELLIATRWHVDDLTGRILEEGEAMGRKVRYISLPALAEEDDILGRVVGESLWPERYSEEALATIKSMQGFWWDALYQQRPVPMGGALFKAEWFEKRFKTIGRGDRTDDGFALPGGELCRRHDCILFIVVDPSLGKKGSDRCAMTVFAVTPGGRLLVLYSRSERIPYDQIVGELYRLNRIWNCEYVGMESDGFQQQLAALARRTLPVPVKDLKTESKSKLSRALPAIELAAQGDIILPEHGEWIGSWITEHCQWTGKDGDRDDQVDCTAYATQRALAIRGLGRDIHAYAGRLRGETQAPVMASGRKMNWN